MSKSKFLKTNKSKFLTTAIFSVIILITTYFAVLVPYQEKLEFAKSAYEVVGTVESTRTEGRSKNRVRYAIINYIVDGKEYRDDALSLYLYPKTGDKVILWVQKGNPRNVVMKVKLIDMLVPNFSNGWYTIIIIGCLYYIVKALLLEK